MSKKTEGRLYRYYKQLKEIDKLEYVCRQLEEQKEKIRNDIKETNISIEEESRSITYEERVQTSSTGSSYAENEVVRQIENLEREWKYVRRKLLKKKARIRELERQVAPLKYNIDMLAEESKRFIEWKYAEHKSIDWIANEMYGGARSTAYRKREELVKEIGQWSDIVK
ncbi:hypothetical protein Z962_p0040 (plasmid) [Clostridium botulinum C/D str. BKT12695]|nr:hypothetical protein Z962_p0040 [Clostridium botulinum C/D str. BKT12695]